MCASIGVGLRSSTDRRRTPAHGVVYQAVPDHLETVRAQTASLREGEGLPRFVRVGAQRAALFVITLRVPPIAGMTLTWLGEH